MQLKDKLDAETIKLIGDEFPVDGLLCEEVNSSHEDGGIITLEVISSWKEATEKLVKTIVEVSTIFSLIKWHVIYTYTRRVYLKTNMLRTTRTVFSSLPLYNFLY